MSGDGEDSLVGTEVVSIDNETAETEVKFCRARGSEPGRTGCRRIYQSPREPLEQRRTCEIRDRHADSAPEWGQAETAQVWVADPAKSDIT